MAPFRSWWVDNPCVEVTWSSGRYERCRKYCPRSSWPYLVVRGAVADGTVEHDGFHPGFRVVVPDPASTGVAVERAADTGGLHGVAEPSLAEEFNAPCAVEGEVEQSVAMAALATHSHSRRGCSSDVRSLTSS